jgi:hypothetical protein
MLELRSDSMRRKTRAAFLGMGLLAVTGVILAGMPATSQGDLDSRLAEFGVPAGAEVIAAQARADGELLTVVYRDSAGVTHALGGVERKETPRPE